MSSPRVVLSAKRLPIKLRIALSEGKTHSSARYVGSDRNTAYFHAVANQRRRKTLIHSLDGPNGPVTEVDEMLKVASDFYKDLFKKENPYGFSLQNIFFSASKKVCLVKMSC